MSWTKRKKIGPYHIEGPLGKGGMGEVYRAHHELLERPVAIKRLFDEALGNQDLVERFLREGRSLGQLHHQGIVTIHDMIENRGELYMVLEFVDGFDLGQLLQHGPFPADVTAIIAVQMALALEHAHYHHIIHRDIKPANCMISRQGEVKLMDFGIARDASLEDLTRTGILVGTPMFMPPEVVTGGRADERADIYAVGCLMYQCLCGRRVYEGATPESIFHRIVDGKYPPLGKVSNGVPFRLRRIVQKCLAKKPEHRFQTAAALKHALEAFLVSHGAWMHHPTRLVRFLHSRNHVTRQEALTCIDAQVLAGPEPQLSRPSRLRPVALGVAVLATMLTLLHALPENWRDTWVKRLVGKADAVATGQAGQQE